MNSNYETSPHFERQLANYAKLLVQYGMNVQKGQIVNVTGEIIHRKLISLVVQEAYNCGAKYVNVDLIDPWHARIRIEETKDESHLAYVPGFIPVKYDELVDNIGASLRILGSEEPDCCADLPPNKVNDTQKYLKFALKRFYQEGIGKSKVQWSLGAAATPKWAQKVYPELPPEKALEALWESIFKICRVDSDNYLDLWKNHNEQLQHRATTLTNMKIKELNFIGPGTDLKVYLTHSAQFIAGGSTGPRGVLYECNIPTEECFTTPDYRLTTGHATVTRPFFVNGKLIEGLKLEFKNGKIVHFTAASGQDTFAAYINSDEGACQLGEVALVGIDSPIYQSGRIFQEILFDENAACHIAVGFAYAFCLKGSETMTQEELLNEGCNNSCVHTDMMISDNHTDVIATSYDGKQIRLLQGGIWQI